MERIRLELCVHGDSDNHFHLGLALHLPADKTYPVVVFIQLDGDNCVSRYKSCRLGSHRPYCHRQVEMAHQVDSFRRFASSEWNRRGILITFRIKQPSAVR